MYKLFSYGELSETEIQKIIFGEEIYSYDGYINDYCLNVANNSINITPCKEKTVKGKILHLTKEQIKVCDQWKIIPLYIKEHFTAITENGEEEVLAYIKLEPDSSFVLVDSIKDKVLNPRIIELAKNYSNNRNLKIPPNDIYLFYPIMYKGKNIKEFHARNQNINKYYLELLNKTLINEYVIDATIGLNICFTDRVLFKTQTDKEAYGSMFCILDKNGAGVLILSINNSNIATEEIVESAFKNNLYIDESRVDSFLEEKYDLIKFDKIKFSLFSQNILDHEVFERNIECLYKYNDKEETRKSYERYKTKKFEVSDENKTKCYFGQNGVIQFKDDYSIFYKNRVDEQIISIAVLVTFTIQVSITEIMKLRVLEFISKYGKSSYNFKEYKLILAENIRYWNLENFKYPISKQLAFEVGKGLDIDKVLFEQQKTIEQLNELQKLNVIIRERNVDKLIKIIIFIVSSMVAVPIILKLVTEIQTIGLGGINIISYIITLISCYSLFFINIIYTRNKALKVR